MQWCEFLLPNPIAHMASTEEPKCSRFYVAIWISNAHMHRRRGLSRHHPLLAIIMHEW